MLDILIKSALVADGTGCPAFRADIGIKGSDIVEIQSVIDAPARNCINAGGLTATPGFIDIHRHGDLTPFLSQPRYEELRQGITTFFSGNCGFSAAPSSLSHIHALQSYAKPIIGTIPACLDGKNFPAFLEAVSTRPMPSNMGYFVGNGALRIAVKGFDPSPMSASEMDKVKGLLSEAFEAGAFALSMGLMYAPENYYSSGELAGVCSVAAKYGRPVITHMRGEGSSLIESIREVLAVTEKSGAPLHISHLKAAGRKNWRRLVPRALELISEANASGRDVSFDVYPYTAGSTALYTLFPPWILSGGVEPMLDRLRDRRIRRELAGQLREEQETWDNLIASTGWESVILAGGGSLLEGRSVTEIARERDVCPEECAMDLLLETNGELPMVFYSMCEDDMEKILTTPGAIVISDALYTDGGLPHPRKYGSQARLISRYALERKVMTLEAAVRSVTALPAERMGLRRRGRLKKGMYADILLLDLEKYRDSATFTNPVSYPSGIEAVILNGAMSLDDSGKIHSVHGRLLFAEN